MADDEDAKDKAESKNKQCSECKGELKNQQAVLLCEGTCNKGFHVKCANVDEKKYKAILTAGSEVMWFCGCCRVKISKQIMYVDIHKDTKAAIEEGYTRLENDLQQLMKETQKLQDVKTYAKVTSTPPTVETRTKTVEKVEKVILKPKRKQESSITKKSFLEAINPTEMRIGIRKIHTQQNGVIAVECRNKAEANILMQEVYSQFGNDYQVDKEKLRKPRLKIVNIEDTRYTKETIMATIKEQNREVIAEHETIEIKHIRKTQTGTITVYVEVEGDTYRKLLGEICIYVAHSRCMIYDDPNPFICYKCNGYNHRAEFCNNKESCALCAGEHKTRDCKSTNRRCIHCATQAKKFKLNLNSEHQAHDKCCEAYQRHLSQNRQKTNYG